LIGICSALLCSDLQQQNSKEEHDLQSDHAMRKGFRKAAVQIILRVGCVIAYVATRVNRSIDAVLTWQGPGRSNYFMNYSKVLMHYSSAKIASQSMRYTSATMAWDIDGRVLLV
jgi:hypothetical protein